MPPKLTVGMATYDDYDGVYFTVQSLRMYHDTADVEIVVVDNNPTSQHGDETRKLAGWVGARYIPYTERVGTAPPRNFVFQVAAAEKVLCIDSHVQLAPGAIARLKDYAIGEDLYSGPMLFDNLTMAYTHMDDVWRAHMRGVWGEDPRWLGEEPFTIPAMGLGLFLSRKSSWLGFNRKFKGFGGEEYYIHDKYRAAGRQCVCLPWLKWLHKFPRPSGRPYTASLWDKVRNYVIGHAELGQSLDGIREHFFDTQLVTKAEWESLVRDPLNPPEESCDCQKKSQPQPAQQDTQRKPTPAMQDIPDSVSLTMMYTATKAASPFMEKLYTLAQRCRRVVEFGDTPTVTTLSLLHGLKGVEGARLRSYHGANAGILAMLDKRKDSVDFHYSGRDPLGEPIAESIDMLVLDTLHNGNQLTQELMKHSPMVRKYIAVLGMDKYSETGERGPGMLHSIRKHVKDHKEWVVAHREGPLLVLSRTEEDLVQPPGVLRRLANFAKASAEHLATGAELVDDETFNTRTSLCLLCPNRNYDVCGLCGCPIDKKASWKEQACPDVPARW